jgi:hypothetical protein
VAGTEGTVLGELDFRLLANLPLGPHPEALLSWGVGKERPVSLNAGVGKKGWGGHT